MVLVCFFFVAAYTGYDAADSLSSSSTLNLAFASMGVQIYALEWLIFYFIGFSLNCFNGYFSLKCFICFFFYLFLQLGTFQLLFLMSDSLFL